MIESAKLWADLKTDTEKAAYLRAGHGWSTGIIAYAIQEEVAEAFEAKTKLRNLAEIAVWRAECLEAADHCFMQRNTFVYSKKDIWKRSFWERWDKSFRHSTKLFKQANADYQAELKAALRNGVIECQNTTLLTNN